MKTSPEERAEVTQQWQKHKDKIQHTFLAVVRPTRVDLLEIGTPEKSTLGGAMELLGGSTFRMSLWNKFDFARKVTVEKAKQYVKEHLPRRVHLSPPCTPFSILQAVNQKTPAQRANLQKKIAWGI